MCDGQVIHILWVTYGTSMTYGRHMEHSHFMVDVQGMSALWNTVRKPKLTKHRQETTQVRLELIFPLLLIQPSGK